MDSGFRLAIVYKVVYKERKDDGALVDVELVIQDRKLAQSISETLGASCRAVDAFVDNNGKYRETEMKPFSQIPEWIEEAVSKKAKSLWSRLENINSQSQCPVSEKDLIFLKKISM